MAGNDCTGPRALEELSPEHFWAVDPDYAQAVVSAITRQRFVGDRASAICTLVKKWDELSIENPMARFVVVSADLLGAMCPPTPPKGWDPRYPSTASIIYQAWRTDRGFFLSSIYNPAVLVLRQPVCTYAKSFGANGEGGYCYRDIGPCFVVVVPAGQAEL